MLPKESDVPESFNIYFRPIPGYLYLFDYTGAPLENTCSFCKRIDETKAVIRKFELYPRITMHILKFLQVEIETVSQVTNELMSNHLMCCRVSDIRLEKCILIFDEIRFGKFSGSFRAPNG